MKHEKDSKNEHIRKKKGEGCHAIGMQLSALQHDFELIAQVTSHDLKDPLRQAIADLEAVKQDYASQPLGIAAQVEIDSVIQAIALVLRRIELLRSYAYLVQGKPVLKPVSCSQIVQKVIEQLKPQIEARQAVITVGDLPILSGDEEQLTVLFRHMVDNALRFCPQKPPHIAITARETGKKWEFCIQDNGIGIDPVYHDFVFSLFQCLDNESPDRSDGAGLTFSRKIARNHGGDIHYESDGEDGTCFYVTLPKR